MLGFESRTVFFCRESIAKTICKTYSEETKAKVSHEKAEIKKTGMFQFSLCFYTITKQYLSISSYIIILLCYSLQLINQTNVCLSKALLQALGIGKTIIIPIWGVTGVFHLASTLSISAHDGS